jgi:Fe(II)/alpha-ketoglutarate-dependent arginine beta-hydroxylase
VAYDSYLALCCALLKKVFGWRLERTGLLLHDVVPLAGREHEQSGGSSDVDLLWHTEEAFHPLRADYVALLCLRNPDHTPTTVATLDGGDLCPEHMQVLREPRFIILPELAHVADEACSTMSVREARLYENGRRQLERQTAAAERVALLYGDPDKPYLRVDPAYMRLPVPGDRLATEAFAALAAVIERKLEPVALTPGDLVVIDNARAVHGRRPFRARYDGRDRWLKRANVTRDLRRSREARLASNSRVVF